jgi:hypothetical protein
MPALPSAPQNEGLRFRLQNWLTASPELAYITEIAFYLV